MPEAKTALVTGGAGFIGSNIAYGLEAAGIATFGPSEAAARLEGSKGFMKDLCAATGVPTAAYGRFTSFGKAERFIEHHATPMVIKADGLAAGKGVIIAETVAEAISAANDIFAGQFGAAGNLSLIHI